MLCFRVITFIFASFASVSTVGRGIVAVTMAAVAVVSVTARQLMLHGLSTLCQPARQ